MPFHQNTQNTFIAVLKAFCITSGRKNINNATRGLIRKIEKPKTNKHTTAPMRS